MQPAPIFTLRERPDLGCIAVRWTGRFSVDQYREFLATLTRTPYFQKCTKMIHDARDCDLNIDSSEIVSAARLPHVASAREGVQRVAILGDTELAFGMLRVLATVRATPGIEIHVFRDYCAALRWLDLPDDRGDVFAGLGPDDPET